MANGQGKWWVDNGDIYIGQHKNDSGTNGKYYELQEDGTHTLFNWANNKKGREISKGHKIAR